MSINFLKNISIFQKIVLLIGCINVWYFSVVMFNIPQMQNLESNVQKLYIHEFVPQNQVNRLHILLNEHRFYVFQHVSTLDFGALPQIKNQVNGLEKQALENLDHLLLDEKNKVELRNKMDDFFKESQDIVLKSQSFQKEAAMRLFKEKNEKHFADLTAFFEELSRQRLESIDVFQKKISQSVQNYIYYLILFMILLWGIMQGIATKFARRIVKPLKDISKACEDLREGRKNVYIPAITSNDELKVMADNFKSLFLVVMQARRLETGVHNMTLPLIMVNEADEIIYCSPAFLNLVQSYPNDFRPLFGDDLTPVGHKISILDAHANKSIQNLSSITEQMLTLKNCTLKITGFPVFNQYEEHLGCIFECQDLTHNLKIEAEIQKIIQKAAMGDLSERMMLENKTGFVKSISENINNLIEKISFVVNDVARMLEQLSTGNLSARINQEYDGVFKMLKDDANNTACILRNTVQAIQTASRDISSVVDNIQKSSNDLSTRTEQQAATIEETAASMEELSSTVKYNAENSHQAIEHALANSLKAQEGQSVAMEAIQSIQEINEASQKITNIISVIDEIAFQTNLLALNASVEAARAGDYGHGFAVVASEVRNLAQRSSVASKEIKTLINASNDLILKGVQHVNQTGDSLSQITQTSQTVAGMMQEISLSSKEQSVGIEQVNTALSHIDEMTQRNAALVQGNDQNIHILQKQLNHLNEKISFFKL